MVKHNLLLITFAFVSLLSNAIDWMEQHLLLCPFKKAFLIDCPGCGLQRSVIALLRGNLAQAWHYYPAIFPMLLLFLVAFFQMRFSFPKGAFILKTLYIVCTAFIIIPYLLKIYNHQLM